MTSLAQAHIATIIHTTNTIGANSSPGLMLSVGGGVEVGRYSRNQNKELCPRGTYILLREDRQENSTLANTEGYL